LILENTRRHGRGQTAQSKFNAERQKSGQKDSREPSTTQGGSTEMLEFSFSLRPVKLTAEF
jgi:hypothetical protein